MNHFGFFGFKRFCLFRWLAGWLVGWLVGWLHVIWKTVVNIESVEIHLAVDNLRAGKRLVSLIAHVYRHITHVMCDELIKFQLIFKAFKSIPNSLRILKITRKKKKKRKERQRESLK